ncbi:hypothetical protein [Glaciimonas sp. PCH181]|uniref:hypothetical protein n=1 Tax=Glaciimonas sp. PCH181 TaxID=2133943 RepID=UPI000D39C273|nr:hypothetical protein [Glaciimonas sp. PCH181]PUA19615.1 hypothetical protein C7W93_07155 [Glaciimonas sp. PCH181]
MSEYNLDPSAAKQADTGGGRITQSGKYIGIFTKAKKVLSQKGTKGIEFTFASNGGQTADYLSVWTLNRDGEQIYGYKQLMAMMTCLRVKGIDATPATIEEYDSATSSMQSHNVEVFLSLQNKPIGVLLQMEEYAKKDGSVAEKASFAGFFDAESEQVATEILEKNDPTILQKLVGQLTTMRKLKTSARPVQGYQGGTGAPDNFDDSVPF